MSTASVSPIGESLARRAGLTARFGILDFVALFGVLAALNYLIAPGDVGWFAVNPSPFLAVPILLGVRYGFSTGVSAGVLTALLLVLGRHVLSHGVSIVDHRFTLVMFPLFGAVVGQVAEGLRRRHLVLEEEKAGLEEQSRFLEAEREMLLLSKEDLQQRLGLFGADSASLDEELQEMAKTSREFAPSHLLAALERMCRVRGAAVYALPRALSAPLTRVASMGDAGKFPEYLYAREHQIIHHAIEEETFLIQKTLLETTPHRSPGYLAAYPIYGTDDSTGHILVLQDLPFDAIGAKSFEVMRSVCDWMKFALASPLQLGASHRSVSQSEFYQAIETAVDTHAQQAVPSTLVRLPFDLPGELDPSEAFRNLLETLPRATVLSNAIESGHRSLLFLLPAIADPQMRDSFRSAFAEFRADLGCSDLPEPVFVLTTPGVSPQQLWGRLVGSGAMA